MKKRILIGVLAVPSALAGLANADVFVDDFSEATLNPMWTLDDQPESYFTEPGYNGGFHMQPEASIARFDFVGNNAYAHIESATTYDTTGGIRTDAILRQDTYPVQTWGMGVAIYFDANNYVALKQSSAGGANGWLKHLNVNGSFTQQTGNTIKDLRQAWIIGGIELTATQIKFYGSQISPNIVDKYGVTDIDANVSEIPEFTIAKPASFTGNATIIIGKGFTLLPSYPGPDFNNSVGSDDYSFAGIDYARIITSGTTAPSWALNGSGDWNEPSNWAGGVPNAVDAVANFGSVITSAQTVFANIPVTVGQLKFDNPNTYEIAGNGSLTIDVSRGSGAINVLQGGPPIHLPTFLNDNTTADVAAGAGLLIADPLTLAAGTTLTKTGGGVMTIEAPVPNAGPAALNVSGGTAVLGYPLGTPASAGAAASAHLSVTVSDGKVALTVDQTLAGLDAVTGNAGDQQIDLAGKQVRVYPTDQAAQELQIYNDIKSAKLSASGQDGIYDSTMPASNYGIGVTDKSLDAHGDLSVLVRLTKLGDANVDGFVDISDLGLLATSWQTAAAGPSFDQALASVGLAGVSVPEPTSLALIGLVVGCLGRKRRR